MTEIHGPVAPTRAVARREPVPRELAALGVQAAVDEESGMQLLIIPKELRAKANVLTPVQAFQQADPNWRPSLRVVELDPSPEGPHFYKQQGGRLAPRKQALELLADAAGVIDIRPVLLGRERVEIGGVTAETFTHLATARIRKSDGTVRVLEASRTYEPFAEYEEIVTSVGSGQYAKKPGTPEHAAEVRKRWLNEIKFAKAKNESKAILRTIRSALQIQHTFAPAEAAKMFLVVGWNLSPQDTPEVRAAIAQLYGTGAPDTQEPREALPAWEPDAVEDAIGEYEFTEVAEGTLTTPPADAPAEATAGPQPAIQSSDVAAGDGDAGQAAEGTDGLQLPLAAASPSSEGAALEAALALRPPAGRFKTATLADLAESQTDWFAKALRHAWSARDAGFYEAVQLVAQHRLPEVFSEWLAEREGL